MNWKETLAELIRRTTSDLPVDVEQALCQAQQTEAPGSQAAHLLQALVENTRLARHQSTPLCQDTGALTFFWHVPAGTDTQALEEAACEAVKQATTKGWLRRNTIETLSGRSVDTNVAAGFPACHFEQETRESIEVWLMQKGGGSENMSVQFSLPDEQWGAGRDLAGVRACVLQAVWQAQGYGCGPGILGVCVGSDRAEGFRVAKEQLLRPLTDEAAEPELARLEKQLLGEANQLGIGPMGMGGRTTLLGVKLAERPRLPASYFVTVAYLCWACRRRGVRVGGEKMEWLG